MKILLLNIFLFILFQLNIFAQTDWEKWDKAETDYSLEDNFRSRGYNFKSENAGEFILKSAASAYWFFISDVDGDNCPFRPSCSVFLLDAVKETNIVQGSLMFADRFTRDLNIFKKRKYPLAESKHYYDPVTLYTLSDKINFIPPGEVISE
jgi:putative component of membrane protein insertase Oxa1/YidC/SpoIIIJ protein YidD